MLLDTSLKRKKKKPLTKACSKNLQIFKIRNSILKLMNKKMRKLISMANMTTMRNLKMGNWKTRLKKETKEMILLQDMQKMDGLITKKITKKACQASRFLRKSIEILICKLLKFFSQMILKATSKNIENYFVKFNFIAHTKLFTFKDLKIIQKFYFYLTIKQGLRFFIDSQTPICMLSLRFFSFFIFKMIFPFFKK